MMAASFAGEESDGQTLLKWPEKLKKPAQIKVPFPTTSMGLGLGLTPLFGQPSHSPTAEGKMVMVSGTPVDHTGYGYNMIKGKIYGIPYNIPDLIALQNFMEEEMGFYSDEIYKLQAKNTPNDVMLCKATGIVVNAFPPSISINAGGRGSNYLKFGNLVISEPIGHDGYRHGIGWDEPSYNMFGHGIRPLPHQHYVIDIPEEAAGGNMQNHYPVPAGEITQQKNYNWGLMGGVAQQAVAGVLANRIAAAGSPTSSLQGVHFMELAVVLGLSFKLAALVLRRPRLSLWMAKIGDMVTGLAIILSLAMHLPPLMAWIAAPLATLIISLALVFA